MAMWCNNLACSVGDSAALIEYPLCALDCSEKIVLFAFQSVNKYLMSSYLL